MIVSSARLSRIRSQLPVEGDSSSDFTAERRPSWLLMPQAAVLSAVFFMAAVSSVGSSETGSRFSADNSVSQLVQLGELMWVPASLLIPFLSRSEMY